MRLPSVLILLIATAFLAPALRRHRAHRPDSLPVPGAAVVASALGSTSAASPSSSLQRLAHWRHRIKSVLEEKHAIGFQTLDRVPAPIRDRHHRPAGSAQDAVLSTPLIARRC